MRSLFPRCPAVISIAMMLASGCYSNRLTSQYDEIPNAEDMLKDEAILEESGQDEESRKARLAELEALAADEGGAYRISAGDSIEIRVYGHDDLGVKTKVGPDGSIGFVFIGQLTVSGKTIAEARDELERGLAPYVKHPIVSVTVLEVAGEVVTVAGACAKPGAYPISTTTRLADAYALAGGSAIRLFNGVNVDVADLEHSFIVRNGRVLPVDMHLAMAGDRLHNVRLHKGDYVYIAQAMQSSITICGDVTTPNRRFYEKGLGLLELLTTAGWMRETHWSHVIIIRGGMSNPRMYKVDVDAILAGKCRNVPLKANDIVYVPHDSLSEYNVFIRKLLPTAQLVNLLTSRVTAFSN